MKSPRVAYEVLQVFGTTPGLSAGAGLTGVYIVDSVQQAMPSAAKRSIHAALGRLEDCGWITSKWAQQPAPGGVRPGKEYKLTKKGAKALEKLSEKFLAGPVPVL